MLLEFKIIRNTFKFSMSWNGQIYSMYDFIGKAMEAYNWFQSTLYVHLQPSLQLLTSASFKDYLSIAQEKN